MPGGWLDEGSGFWGIRGMGTAPGMGLLGFDGSITHCMPRAPHSPQKPSCSKVTVGAFQAVSIISTSAHERCTGIVPIFQVNKGILSEFT